MWKIQLASYVSVALLLTSIACTRVHPPPSDATPPFIIWGLSGPHSQTVTQNNTVIQVKADDKTDLISFTGEDDESGINHLDLGGGGSYTCESNGLGTVEQISIAGKSQDFPPDANGDYLKNPLILIESYDLGHAACGAGSVFKGGEISYNGKARNSVGATVSGTIIFRRTQ